MQQEFTLLAILKYLCVHSQCLQPFKTSGFPFEKWERAPYFAKSLLALSWVVSSQHGYRVSAQKMTATVLRVHRAPHTGTAGFLSSQPDSLWSCGPYAVSTPKSHEDSLWRELSLHVDHPACGRWRAEPEFPHLPPGLSAGPRSGSACTPTLLLFCATWVMQRATASPGQRSQDERATTSPALPVPPPV